MLKTRKKLNLKKETIRSLETKELSAANGAGFGGGVVYRYTPPVCGVATGPAGLSGTIEPQLPVAQLNVAIH